MIVPEGLDVELSGESWLQLQRTMALVWQSREILIASSAYDPIASVGVIDFHHFDVICALLGAKVMVRVGSW